MSGDKRPNPIPVIPDRLCWSSAIGLFILNFSTLDLYVQDFLENNLSPEEFIKVKCWHLRDRVERIKQHVQQTNYAPDKRRAIEEFFVRFEPFRELRNHIAHGLLRIGLGQDQKTWILTLSLPKDLDGTNSPTARHLEYVELEKALSGLTELTEEFRQLA